MMRLSMKFGLPVCIVFYILLGFVMSVQAQASTVFVMHISGRIDSGWVPHVHRVLREAEAQGVDAVIVHIDTPGGRADAAAQIRDALLNTPVRTIAFIDKKALSAGALIALACQEIYMTGGSVMGAAAPVSIEGLPASEKAVSAIRKLFRATAEHHNRPPEIAEAMVDGDVTVEGVVEAGKLLTLTTREALTLKIADGKADDLASVLEQLDMADHAVTQVTWNWAEWLVQTLTRWPIPALLLLVGFLALWVEFLEPGLSLSGVIGLICLGLFFGSHHLIGLAGWEEALLIGLGIIFLAVEFFIIPGFGVAGVLGIIALGAGMYLSLLGNYPTSSEVWHAGLSVLSVVILVLMGIFAMLTLFAYNPGWSRLSLNARLRHGTGQPEGDLTLAESPWLGTSGVTETPLMPSGAGTFRGQRLDIVSEGDYVPVETPVTIVRVEGHRIVVRRTEPIVS